MIVRQFRNLYFSLYLTCDLVIVFKMLDSMLVNNLEAIFIHRPPM